MNRLTGRRGITIVEIVIYGSIIAIIGGSVWLGVHSFWEWNCIKTMQSLDQGLELYIGEKSKRPDKIEDFIHLSPQIAATDKPKCHACPVDVDYIYSELDTKIRCPFHGIAR